MSYSIFKQGGPDDVVRSLREEAQRVVDMGLPAEEAQGLNDGIDYVESVMQEKGQAGDQVTASLNGHRTESDMGFSVSRNIGVQIDMKGRAALLPQGATNHDLATNNEERAAQKEALALGEVPMPEVEREEHSF